MRDLELTTKNVLRINDAVSGETVEVYYRTPTTSERVGFEKASHQMKKGRFFDKSAETRIEYGLKIMTGIREGDFGVAGVPISSDPANKNYRSDWKDLMKETAGDIISALALTVFQGARVDDADEDVRDEDTGEETIPFGMSCES